jgi:hypothetical protein
MGVSKPFVDGKLQGVICPSTTQQKSYEVITHIG